VRNARYMGTDKAGKVLQNRKNFEIWSLRLLTTQMSDNFGGFFGRLGYVNVKMIKVW